MRIFILIAMLLVLGSFHHRENRNDNPMVMCHDPNNAIDAFATFANDKGFLDAHPSPLPAEFFHQGTMVEFSVDEGDKGHAYFAKAQKSTNKYLLVFQEWWGLNDYIKNEADMWSNELGVNVLAIDLYDGKVATTAEEAGKLMQGCDPKRATALIEGAAKYAGDKANFRTIGWCFGGGWSLQAAILLKNKVKACVMYYGMPEKDTEKLKNLSSSVLFIHPTQDKWITADVVSEFEKNMKTDGKTLTVRHYDADHAFANPSSARYNDAAAKDARAAAKAYLKSK